MASAVFLFIGAFACASRVSPPAGVEIAVDSQRAPSERTGVGVPIGDQELERWECNDPAVRVFGQGPLLMFEVSADAPIGSRYNCEVTLSATGTSAIEVAVLEGQPPQR